MMNLTIVLSWLRTEEKQIYTLLCCLKFLFFHFFKIINGLCESEIFSDVDSVRKLAWRWKQLNIFCCDFFLCLWARKCFLKGLRDAIDIDRVWKLTFPYEIESFDGEPFFAFGGNVFFVKNFRNLPSVSVNTFEKSDKLAFESPSKFTKRRFSSKVWRKLQRIEYFPIYCPSQKAQDWERRESEKGVCGGKEWKKKRESSIC